MPSFKLIIAGMMMTIGAVGTAHAAPITFNLTSPDSRNGILNSTYAMQYNYAEDDLALGLTGWSYGLKTTTSTQCTRTNRFNVCTRYKTTTTTSVDEAIEQAYVGRWDGLGVEKTDSPNHAVDNEEGDYDMHLLSFDDMVKLTSLDIGWYDNDTDISILAFNGTSFDNSSLLGKKWQDLIGDGWSVVGNYYNVDSRGNSGAVNAGGVVSQYWLVGAYNLNFGQFNDDNRNRSNGDDYFKLNAVTLERPPEEVEEVPEPATALLLAASLMGLALARRKAS
jgi:hypothetical protein